MNNQMPWSLSFGKDPTPEGRYGNRELNPPRSVPGPGSVHETQNSENSQKDVLATAEISRVCLCESGAIV